MSRPLLYLAACVYWLAFSTAVDAQPARKDAFGDPLPPHAIARIGSQRLRHGTSITGLEFSPDSKYLASADQHGGVRLWDTHTATLVAVLAESGNRPAVLTFAPDGRVLAANDRSEGITLYAIPSGKVLHQLKDEGQPPLPVRFSPDGKLLAAAAWGKNPVLWDVATGKLLFTLAREQPPLIALGFAADGATVLGADNRGAIHRWRTKDGAWLGATPAVRVRGAAFSPDGKVLACGGKDGDIWLRDTTSGKELRRWLAGDVAINELAFTADGKALTTQEIFGAAKWWDVATGKERPLPGGGQGVGAVAIAADVKTVATSEGVLIRLWDVGTGKERFANLSGPEGAVWSRSLSPDIKTLATRGLQQSGTCLWDTATGRLRQTLEDKDADTRWFAFQPGGRLMVTTDRDQRVHLWDAVTGKKQATLAELKTSWLTFTPDGAALVWGEGEHLYGWDIARGKKSRTRTGKSGFLVDWCLFAPDGRTVAIRQSQPKSKLPALVEVVSVELATGKERRLLQAKNGEIVTPIRFSPDGRLLALRTQPHLGIDGGCRIEVVEVASGTLAYSVARVETTRERQGVWQDVAFAADGKTLIYSVNNELFLANALTGVARTGVYFRQPGDITWSLTADGKVLVVAASDLTVTLWDTAGLVKPVAAPTKELTAHEATECWACLASKDAVRAWRCVDRLCAGPEQAVTLLKERLRAVPRVDEATLAGWVADMDDKRFAVRNKAAIALEQLGDVAVPLLRQKLMGVPPLESQRRIEQLLAKIDPEQAGEVFRLSRAVAVLEQVNTPAARQLLQALAQGAPQARLTQEAQGTLKRLASVAAGS